MKILIFLWNPGEQFQYTKHNIWFLVGDELAKTRNCTPWSLDKQSKALITSTNYNGEKLLLVKPQTFMNLSGQTISSLLWYYKLTAADIVVIHDDIDLPTGTIRRKIGGSSGGQNGVKDTIAKLGTDNFARVKIGIDRPSHPAADIADYVLSKLSKESLEHMRQTADQVLDRLNNHFFVKKE
jgi:PTH1 family peptidyl-tRNA hydrolase